MAETPAAARVQLRIGRMGGNDGIGGIRCYDGKLKITEILRKKACSGGTLIKHTKGKKLCL